MLTQLRSHRFLLAIYATVFGLVLICATSQTATGSSVLAISEVRISNVTSSGFTLSWLTNQPTEGAVHFGTDADNLDQVAHDVRGAGISTDAHYVIVSDLAAETTYYFDIVTGNGRDEIGAAHYQVTTGPRLGIPPVDTIYGQVLLPDGTTPATDCIVLVTLRDADGVGDSGEAMSLSDLIRVAEDGFWNINLAEARTAQSGAYFDYSASGDETVQEVHCGRRGLADQSTATAADSPAPTITLREILTYTLTVTTTGDGSGHVSLSPPGGVYDEGSEVTLTANSDDGANFVTWSGDCTGTTITCTLVMDGDKNVSAQFAENEPQPMLYLPYIVR